MANFVEQATLKLVDRTSTPARKITTELVKLYKAQKKLEQTSAGRRSIARFNANQIANANKELNKFIGLQKQVAQRTITLRINSSQIISADRRAQVLQERLRRLVTTNNTIGGRQTPRDYAARAVAGDRSGRIGIDIHPLKAWSTGFIYRLGYKIENSIISGFAQGTKEVVVGETKLQQRGYMPDQIREIDRRVYQKSASYGGAFSPADIRNTFAELGTILGKDPLRADKLVDMALQYQAVLRGEGYTPEQSTTGMRAIFKAFDNMNRLQDSQGKISKDIDKYFRVIVEETIRSGSDITPEKINTALVYMRTTGKTVSPEGLRQAINMLESMGRVAGSSMNRFVMSLTGTTTAKALQEQANAGLITLAETKTGRVGSKGKTQVVRDTTIDEELLREDPNAWAIKHLIPAAIKRAGIDPNDSKAIDDFLNNAVAIAKVLDPLFGSVVAKDVANNFVAWQAEYKSAVEASKNIPSFEQLKEIFMRSPVAAMQGMKLQFDNLLGEIGASITKGLITPLTHLNMTMLQTSWWLKDIDNDGAGSGRRSLLLAGGAAVAGYASLKAFEKFSGFGQLKVASINLNEAARNLNIAARNGIQRNSIVAGTGKKTGILMRYGVPVGIAAGVAGNYFNDYLQSSEASESWKAGGNIMAAALDGAILGSYAGPWGTAIGAAIGTVIGATIEAYKHDEKLKKWVDEKIDGGERRAAALKALRQGNGSGPTAQALKYGMSSDMIGSYQSYPIVRETNNAIENIDLAKQMDDIQENLKNSGILVGKELEVSLVTAADAFGMNAAAAMNRNFNPSLTVNIPTPAERPNLGRNDVNNR